MTMSNDEGRKREGNLNNYYHERCVKVSKRCASAADGSCTPTPKEAIWCTGTVIA